MRLLINIKEAFLSNMLMTNDKKNQEKKKKKKKRKRKSRLMTRKIRLNRKRH